MTNTEVTEVHKSLQDTYVMLNDCLRRLGRAYRILERQKRTNSHKSTGRRRLNAALRKIHATQDDLTVINDGLKAIGPRLVKSP